jgi:hypothetical protein
MPKICFRASRRIFCPSPSINRIDCRPIFSVLQNIFSDLFISFNFKGFFSSSLQQKLNLLYNWTDNKRKIRCPMLKIQNGCVFTAGLMITGCTGKFFKEPTGSVVKFFVNASFKQTFFVLTLLWTNKIHQKIEFGDCGFCWI